MQQNSHKSKGLCQRLDHVDVDTSCDHKKKCLLQDLLWHTFIAFWDNDVVNSSVHIFQGHPSFKEEPLIWLVSDEFNIVKAH